MKRLMKLCLILGLFCTVIASPARADTVPSICRPAKSLAAPFVPMALVATEKCLEAHYNPNDPATDYGQIVNTLDAAGIRNLLDSAYGLSMHQRVLILNDYAFWEFKTNNVVEMPYVIQDLSLVLSLSPNRTAAWLNLGDAYRYEIEMGYPPDENFERGITAQQKVELAAKALDAYKHYLTLAHAPLQRVRDYVALATSPVTAGTASWSTLDAIENMTDHPVIAAQFLRNDHDPAAKLALAMDLALLLPNSDAHQDEINKLMAESVAGVDVDVPADGFDGTAASFVPYLQAEGQREQETEFQRFPIPCQLAEKFPDLMQAAQAHWGSNRDNFDPVIVCTDTKYQLPPSIDTLETDLRAQSGFDRLCGSVRNAIIVGTWSDKDLVRYQPRMFLPPTFSQSAEKGITAATLPLQAWGETDISSYNIAKLIDADFLKARADLIVYYKSSFDLSPSDAQLAAGHAIWMIEDAESWAATGKTDPLAEALLTHRPLTEIEAESKLESDGFASMLFLAVQYPEALNLLLAQKPDLTVTTPIGKTVLMEAAKYNQLESIKLLLAAGADVNATSLAPGEINDNQDLNFPNGPCGGTYAITHGSRTALMYAASNATLPVIKALLAAGADKHAKDSMGATALDYLEGRGPVTKNPVLDTADFKTAESLLAP